MKKLLLCLSLGLLFLLPTDISALETEQIVSSTIEYLDDGSYLETTITESNALTRATKTGSKTTKYYNDAKVAQWYVKVTGTYTYNNSSATCTSSSVTADSYKSIWKIASKSASKNANKATAKATANQYYDGTLVNTKTTSVTLTCSATGKLS